MRNDEYEMEMEFDTEYEAHANLPFDEAREMELAAELLEYRSDEEMEYFLSNLAHETGGGLQPRTTKGIGTTLVKTRKRLKANLPAISENVGLLAGAAAGGTLGASLGPLGKFGGAALGGKYGAKGFRLLGDWIAERLEMELEGVSPEDMEFETARRVVRLAGAAGQRVAALKRSGVDSNTATTALISATKACIPVLTGNTRDIPGSLPNSGRWVRRDDQIVLTGV